MESFPDALVVEILQRLPVKSIFRFKSVCKHWLSIISDPLFVRSYTHQITTNSRPWTLFAIYETGRSSSLPPDHMGLNKISLIPDPDSGSPGFNLQFFASTIDPIEQKQRRIKILASDKGLLLYCSMDDCQKLGYYVCNPITMKWVCLPRPLCQPKWVKEGFLVENGGGNYWVVRVAQLQFRSRVFNIEVFSSETGKWRYSKVSCPRRIRFFVKKRPTVCYNGIVHWLADNYCIIAYDPKSDTSECRVIDLPSDRESRILGVLGVCCGFLRYVEVSDTYLESFQTPSLGVWLLENYDAGEWRLEHRINRSEIASHDDFLNDILSWRGWTMRALAFHPFDLDTIYLNAPRLSDLNSDCHRQMVSYNPSTRSLEIVDCDSCPEAFIDTWEVFPFVLPEWPTPVPQPSWEAN